MSDQSDPENLTIGPKDNIIIVRENGDVEVRVRVAPGEALSEGAVLAVGFHAIATNDDRRHRLMQKTSEYITRQIRTDAKWKANFHMDNGHWDNKEKGDSSDT